MESRAFILSDEIVGAGYANLMTMPPNLKHQERFLMPYREARDNKRGLWLLISDIRFLINHATAR